MNLVSNYVLNVTMKMHFAGKIQRSVDFRENLNELKYFLTNVNFGA